MIKQYLKIKEQYSDSILFFRLGDFYEMFFEDAHCASRELEITLTSRDGGKEERVPMCGVPYHAAETYISRLVEKGYKVAICEQVEDPKASKGIVKREVIRVITPGTILTGAFVEEKRNNYIIALNRENNCYGMAVVDIGTGLFMAAEFSGEYAVNSLLEEITRLQPSEAVIPYDLMNDNELDVFFRGHASITLSRCLEETFSYPSAREQLIENIGEENFNQTGLTEMAAAVGAAGGLLAYLKSTQKRSLNHLNTIKIYKPSLFMILDSSTRRNLELIKSLRDGSKRGSLLWVLDHTVTAMGARLLKTWLEQPLVNVQFINERLDAVAEFNADNFLRYDLKEVLSKLYDLERLTGRIAYGTANARDLYSLKVSLSVLPKIKEILSRANSQLLAKIARQIDPLTDLCDLLERAILENPPISVREGGIIKDGFSSEVDQLRTASRDGKSWVAGLEARERERTGIKSLKVGYNKVFGYYLEVTKTNLHLVPDEYIRKQTLANAERYITPELKEYENLILGAQDKLNQLEYQLFVDIRNMVAEKIPSIQKTAHAVSQADVLLAFAETALENKYCRPIVREDGLIKIKDGRHPVVERVLESGEFVPNDTVLNNSDSRLILITGPNMAGKSTYMRQVALIVLMAQVGSFVPADYAEVSVVDRIFTRVGAADDLAGGQSTFMVEMKECQVIVENATANSLVIMDEVGRGTSTYDGISIARALVEHINEVIRAKTLFSTHYHELTDLDSLSGVVNYTVAVREDGEDIVFLRKVIPGKADRSYGIHVARLAGIPEHILERAGNLLYSLESRNSSENQVAAGMEVGMKLREKCLPTETISVDLKEQENDAANHPVLSELAGLEILNMTPLQALNKLYELQTKVKHK
ncbi:DNA mismatch repair protein MutS [Desulfolucanica intricata]|uniref:DNA mismatch repair protein MutS n=1 Tax=Desulfolucanica intricata TaxID=1285191 RepID=UPI001A9A5B4D|nr:DNA mismatch repair protein MutS [Desulfolucanica intricata]